MRCWTDDTDGGTAARERHEIDDRYKWRLDRIFPDWTAWESAFAEVESALPRLAALRGTLAEGGPQLLSAIETIHGVQRRLEVVSIYASMRSDEDTRDSANTGRRGRAASLGTSLAEAVSWFEPELLALADEVVDRYLQECESLRPYVHYLDDLRRLRRHTLDAEREALLAAAGNVTRGANRIFSALTDADLRFPTIRDEQGREVELTHSRYSKYLRSRDRAVRRQAFEGYLDTYGRFGNTLAATMDANVKNHVFRAECRRYDGCLHSALFPNAVPVDVFHNLIAEVRANLGVVHRYAALKKRALAVDELREHDLYVPLFAEAELKFGYEEACDLLLEALAPLGPEYLAIVRAGYREGWIDVHESLGKRSGAYSGGVYDTQPYILLNWSDQLSDTFTLAHELGHSVHTYLATHNQPYVYGDYPIFTAEVASTFNELLLIDHLLARTTDRDRRLYLLDHHLNQMTGTVVRQTMFAEFELRLHELGEARETLTAESLGEVFHGLLAEYWGPAATLDPVRSRLTWSRIPHFYYNFYVYQYATAYSAAAALERAVLGGGERERERYLDILRSGSSRYPVETLAAGGVDMRTREPFRDVFRLYAQRIDQIERLLAGKA
ncbi:MAG TPA: oligoendopeptidase F [Candidatus Krumholzibacteria bacterium]|nr:oligoendopeptidase F [Candidatus Krumholzibacteria bacterium]HPD73342.1 oligoendopeptidase F [Candidatus Krumholzibacteria bacterium]HRY42137.1 oligoendopeptidase F [Candidatus Krumholzibacteria bacterium]